MMTTHPASYGLTQAAAATPHSLALEELARNGFTILAEALSPGQTAAMRDALDAVLAAQTARFGAERLAAIGDAGQARALLGEAPIFLDILRVAALEALVEALLGPAALVMQQNGIAMPPQGAAHHQQSWHRDLPYQSWVASKPLALGALAVLDDFTAVSGATFFLPGSQSQPDFPSAAYAAQWAHQAITPAGSIVVFDAMCFHSGGVNRGHAPRRAVNTLFGIPLLTQQIAFADRPGLDPKLRQRLGLDYAPQPGVDAWREARHRRLASRTA